MTNNSLGIYLIVLLSAVLCPVTRLDSGVRIPSILSLREAQLTGSEELYEASVNVSETSIATALPTVSGDASPKSAQLKTETQITKPLPESLAVRVESFIDLGSKNWRPPEPEKNIFALVTIKLATNEQYAIGDFKVRLEQLKEEMGSCVGYRIGSAWAVQEDPEDSEVAKRPTLFTSDKVASISFVFVVPKTSKEITVLYKNKPIGKALPLPEK